MAVSTTLTFFNHLGRKTYLELGLYYIGHQQRCLIRLLTFEQYLQVKARPPSHA